MRYQKLSIGLVAAALTLSLSSAWAQDRGRPRESEPASRPSSGDSVGSAVPRGSDGGATSSPSSSAGSATSPSNIGSATNSANPAANAPSSWMDGGSARPVAARAPIRPDRADRFDAAAQRHNPGNSTGDRAVPRGDSGSKTSGSTSSTSASSGSQNQPAPAPNRAVPDNSRPRDGRNQTGTATARTNPPYSGGGYYSRYPVYGYYPSYIYDPFYSFYYSPYYNRYAYWSPYGYGYGLGYFSYDPYLFGALGYPDYGYGGGGYGYGGGYGSVYPDTTAGGSGGGSAYQAYHGAGSLRLKIKPSNAQVYIDGNLVGAVDSFDGAFQKLTVDAGPHHVELRAEGYQTTSFDVVITPDDTITYKGDMKRK